MDDRNETLELKRRAYSLLFVKPCMSDKTKKMAEAHLAHPPALSQLNLPGFRRTPSPELDLVRFTRGKMSVIVFQTGAVSIRNAVDETDVVRVMDQLSSG